MKSFILSGNAQVIKDIEFCLNVRFPDSVVESFDSGQQGIECLSKEIPDVVFIDADQKDVATKTAISSIREFSDVGIVFLCDGQTELERAELLEAGADDYVTIPFSPIEFLAKVRALLRRTHGHGFKPRHVVSLGKSVSVDLATREVTSFGEVLRLTPIEYNILLELLRNQGQVLTNETLLEKVWGSEYRNDLSFVKKYMYRLRGKMEPDKNMPKVIHNERGIGYRMDAGV